MDINQVLKDLDAAFERADTASAEQVLQSGISEAINASDDGALLQLLNEYLGFLRETGRADESYVIADRILSLMDRMGLAGSIPYATSLLNIANAYRAGGRLADSLAAYDKVEEIYKTSLPSDSMLMASFYNNKALLLQESGRLEEAAECLNKALSIVESKGEPFEIAVTHANLSNTYLGLSDSVKAVEEAKKAIDIFEKTGTLDSHYASALYSLGICEVSSGNLAKARKHLETAADIMEKFLGKNEFWYRIKDAIKELDAKEAKDPEDPGSFSGSGTQTPIDSTSQSSFSKGLDIARAFYEECFKPVIDHEFAGYRDRISVGLFGRGSDCYGYDDEASRDHDWGPGFVVLTDSDTFEKIGPALEQAYDSLPKEYMGYRTAPVVSGHKRRGVFVIEDYFRELLGRFPISPEDYVLIPDHALSSAVNGEIFTDPSGSVEKIRDELRQGYPEPLLYLKIAESMSRASQCAQYNFERMLKRGDELTASMMLSDGLKEVLKLAHYLENKYPPHDKWLFKSAHDLDSAGELIPLISAAHSKKEIAPLFEFLASKAYEAGFISDIDDYLDHHSDELLFKAEAAKLDNKELVKKIARVEFEAFDKVQNEGGRASCQNDWYTFSIMRESQYMTWTREMLLQYYYDFTRELSYGHNLITEKYGRMMESTAPERYEEIKDHFPVLSPEKKKIIEAVVSIQVGWMHEFTEKYPKLGDQARSVDTFDDNAGNTSYETYLRGEISTYSDKMLQLYAAFIAELAGSGRNLAFMTIENSVRLYGYDNLDDAESKA